MNYAKTLKYGLQCSLKTIVPYYVTVAILLILFGLMIQREGSGTIHLGSWDVLSAFVIAFGIVGGFKERFHIFLQHGLSRKSLFMHYLIGILMIVLFMAGVEEIIHWLASQLHLDFITLYDELYESRYIVSTGMQVIERFLWHVTFFAGITSLALCIMIAFYRLRKLWRNLIFIALPITSILTASFIDGLYFQGQLFPMIMNDLWHFLGLYQDANPYQAIGSIACIALVFFACSYRILRKLNVQT